jgi:predicted alpha/beta hydrolase family esterase
VRWLANGPTMSCMRMTLWNRAVAAEWTHHVGTKGRRAGHDATQRR